MSDVLIVDDEKPVRELLSRWIAAEGLALHEAADAEAALGVLAARTIGVVLVDKDMPGHDGTWLVEQIHLRHPGVAMLLATGDPAIAPRVSLSRGVRDYLVKPFTRDIVVAAVREAMNWHQTAATQQAAVADVDAWLTQDGADFPPTDAK